MRARNSHKTLVSVVVVVDQFTRESITMLLSDVSFYGYMHKCSRILFVDVPQFEILKLATTRRVSVSVRVQFTITRRSLLISFYKHFDLKSAVEID